jgi:hypothetical protein
VKENSDILAGMIQDAKKDIFQAINDRACPQIDNQLIVSSKNSIIREV